MAPFDCPSPRAKRRALFCQEGEESAEGWPRAQKRARAGPAAAAWPCHAVRPAHSMRPGGLGQARGWARGALLNAAGVVTSDSGLAVPFLMQRAGAFVCYMRVVRAQECKSENTLTGQRREQPR
jgi:hypothetical protein